MRLQVVTALIGVDVCSCVSGGGERFAATTTALYGSLHGTGPEFVVRVGSDAVAQRGKE